VTPAEYRCEATSIEGFIQQLAVRYLGSGYRYYATGYVRDGKDPREIDRKIVEKYDIDIDKWKRHRRKAAGLANVQYIRFFRAFFILATGPRGGHRFFQEEAEVLDAREVPIKFSGYALSYTELGVRVRIDREVLKEIRAYFLDAATRKRPGELVKEFRELPFEPYRPVRYQLHRLRDDVNAKRKAAGLPPVPERAVRKYRRICRPFEPEATGSGA
jgi:hypothetical protein